MAKNKPIEGNSKVARPMIYILIILLVIIFGVFSFKSLSRSGNAPTISDSEIARLPGQSGEARIDGDKAFDVS